MATDRLATRYLSAPQQQRQDYQEVADMGFLDTITVEVFQVEGFHGEGMAAEADIITGEAFSVTEVLGRDQAAEAAEDQGTYIHGWTLICVFLVAWTGLLIRVERNSLHSTSQSSHYKLRRDRELAHDKCFISNQGYL